jgi:hypothetical protein
MDKARKFEVTFVDFHLTFIAYVGSELLACIALSTGSYSKQNQTFREQELVPLFRLKGKERLQRAKR